MSVISCRLFSRETELAIGSENTQSLIYRIATDGPMSQLDIYDQARTASPHPLPSLYAAIEIGYVLRIRITAQSQHNWTKYLAHVTIGQPAGQQGGSVPTPGYTAPLNRDPVMWIERGSESVPVTKDKDGKAIVNSAGQPFDEPIFRDRPTNVFVVRRYFNSLVAIDTLNSHYDNTTNSDPILSRAIGELRYLGTETGEPVIEEGAAWWIGLTKVAARKGGWKAKILDRGWKVKTVDGTGVINATDANGMQVTEPELLDGAGYYLGNIADPVFLEFALDDNKAYSPLFSVNRDALDDITNP